MSSALSSYVETSYLSSTLSDYVTNSYLSSQLSNYATVSDIGDINSVLDEINGTVIWGGKSWELPHKNYKL